MDTWTQGRHNDGSLMIFFYMEMVAQTDMDGWLYAWMVSEITEIIKHKRNVRKKITAVLIS